MSYDVFISYRSSGGLSTAKWLHEKMRKKRINSFFDDEKLKEGPFDEHLYEAIDSSKDFLLVLPKNSLERCKNSNDWVRFEIERAFEKEINIIPVMLEDFEWPDDVENYPDFLPKLMTLNGIRLYKGYMDAAVDRIASMLTCRHKKAKQKEKTVPENIGERVENLYFSFDDKKELRRLKIQQDLIKDFEKDVYKRAAEKFDELRILDLGSNNGNFIMDRIGKSKNLSALVGLEYDASAVDYANEHYGEKGRIEFHKCHLESESMPEELSEIIENMGIESFNVVNISMLLLHLQTPYKLLKNIRKFIERGGMVIIKDIDDGLNMAYPDPDGKFARVVSICKYNEGSGYRSSGRQIYTLLKRSGFRNIKLENVGLSTVNMDFEERSALFDTYFSFILEDLKAMVKKYPNENQFKKDLDWYSSDYENLEEQFQDDNFFFTLGFILYTAEK